MIELNDLYDYGLKIYQNTDYFKFSLDSILLAEFTKFNKNDTILDICTGNAPIPLILSTRGQYKHIDAVEIQKEIYELAKKSVEENELDDKISVYNEDIKKYESKEKYDVVICNPPYFKVSDTSYKNEDEIKRIARHEVKLTLEEAIKSANRLLKEKGSFYMVQRTDRFLETIELLKKENLGIRRTVFVYTKSGNSAEFFLVEASKYKKDDIKVYSVEIENRKTYKKIFEEG